MRVRPILQGAPRECGLACVAMIAAHGIGVTMKSLRDQLEVGRDGLSLQDPRSLLTSHGYEAKAFRAQSRLSVRLLAGYLPVAGQPLRRP